MTLKAPFPYFGGKSQVASVVWDAFGDVPNYVEPFAGSLAVLLSRPPRHVGRIETVNDLDALLSNFWRATQADPDAVAKAADWILHEADAHARHLWLVRRKPELVSQLTADPDYYDARAAGWWVWGICQWIGSGWCSGDGPWTDSNGEFVNMRGTAGMGINRQRPHLGDAGRGGQCDEWSAHLRAIMRELADRLRRVRVCCGEWQRVCGPTPTTKLGLTAVLLDPPYSSDRSAVYSEEDFTVAHDVRTWAIEHGEDRNMRIALCGHIQEHEEAMPESWRLWRWKARGGYESQGGENRTNVNSTLEAIWFSPHCLHPEQGALL